MSADKVEWKFVVKRTYSPLFYELINIGNNKKAVKELLGINSGFDNYRSIEGEVSFCVSEIEEAKTNINEYYSKQGVQFFKALLDKWYTFITVNVLRVK